MSGWAHNIGKLRDCDVSRGHVESVLFLGLTTIVNAADCALSAMESDRTRCA